MEKGASATSGFISDERYRFIDLDQFPLGRHHFLGYSRRYHSGQCITRQSAELLKNCTVFETLDEHASRFIDILPQKMTSSGFLRNFFQKNNIQKVTEDQLNAIKSELCQLANAGFLVSYSELFSHLNRLNTTQKPDRKISSLGFVTSNRTRPLGRALKSYIENVKQYGRQTDFVVMDGSSCNDAPKANQQLLQQLYTQYGVEIFYGGVKEKRKYARALVDTGIPPDIINFALFDVENCGHSTGANRNALMLHSIGQLVCSLDDDTVCHLSTTPAPEKGLSVQSGLDPTETWLYPDRPSVLQEVQYIEKDFLGFHERLLGKRVSQCIAESGEEDVDFDKMGALLYRRLLQGDGRILTTFSGISGDSGCGCPSFHLLLNDASLGRLIQSEVVYQYSRKSSEVIRVAPGLTISDASFCMTYAYGFDNRNLLPPFMPVHRGQDGTFGQVLWKCFTDGYFGHIPCAILHEPPDARSFSGDDIWRCASTVRINDVLRILIKAFEIGPGQKDNQDRLKALGKYLIEWGQASSSDFEEYLQVLLCRRISAISEILENRLNVFKNASSLWKLDVQRYIDELQKGLDYALAPCDLREGRDAQEAGRLSQKLITRFGELLQYWPDIVDGVRHLQNQNIRLAQSVRNLT